MKIYVSSTLSDLTEHRAAVRQVMNSLSEGGVNFEYTGVEYLSAEPNPPLGTYLHAVQGADFILLLIGWRYGYVPEGSEKSVVELEYEAAVESKLAVLTYLIDDSYPVPPNLVELGQGAIRLRAFKERLRRERVVSYFTSPDDLAKKVAVDLTHYYTRSIIEAAEDIIARPQLETRLRQCEEQNTGYLAIIDDLRSRQAGNVPASPIWSTRNFNLDPSLCFVLMPFHDSFFSIYEQAIVPAVEEAGLRALHAGEIFGNREIVEDIWESICTAKLIIADVSQRNPNVFYELGIPYRCKRPPASLGRSVFATASDRGDSAGSRTSPRVQSRGRRFESSKHPSAMAFVVFIRFSQCNWRVYAILLARKSWFSHRARRMCHSTFDIAGMLITLLISLPLSGTA